MRGHIASYLLATQSQGGTRGGTNLNVKDLKVVVKPFDRYGGKHWVKCRFQDRWDWVPAFQDLFRIIQAICFCEDEKYPPPAKGREFVREFMEAACTKGATWEGLRERFQIPDRSAS